MVISSGPVLGALVDRAHRVGEFGGIFDATEMNDVLKDWARAQSHTAHRSSRARVQSSAFYSKAQLFQAIAPLLHAKSSVPYSPIYRMISCTTNWRSATIR